MPEGLEMVRMSWSECHPQEVSQLLLTEYKLPRPTSYSSSTRVHTFQLVPGLYGLYWGAGPLGPPNPRGHTLFALPLFSPVPHPCSETKLLSEKNSWLSFLSCNFVFSTFISSSFFPKSIRNSLLLPVLGLWNRRSLGKSYSLSLSPIPRGTGLLEGVWRSKASFHILQGAAPTSGTELHALASQSLSLIYYCGSDNFKNNSRTRREKLIREKYSPLCTRAGTAWKSCRDIPF